MAAELILEHVGKTVNDRDNYTLPNFNENNIFEGKNRQKKNEEKWNKRVASIAHVIITAMRPRSFLSPILIGLSVMMHKMFASRGLLECLSHVGFSVSYDETTRFETSIVHYPNLHTFDPLSFIQYVYDNADHNTATIDGKNTFHAMGGIKIVTPSSSVQSKKTIPRLKTMPSSEITGKFGFLPIVKFDKTKESTLKKKRLKILERINGRSPLVIFQVFT